MEYIKIIFYASSLIFAILILSFNFIYSYRIKRINNGLGIKTPVFLKKAIAVNAIIAFVGTTCVGLIFTSTLFNINL